MIHVVVADANVLVSAALARSPAAPSALVLDAALDGRVGLIASPTLLAEIGSVLIRPRLRRYLSLDEAARFVADLGSQMTLISDAPVPHPTVCRDPNDDYLVALAVKARASVIVTGDRDLLELPDPPVPVITPRAFLARLDASA
ncbi:MAG: putative toxin-antitoxin system toxin component, PIN family [Solirubrobacteraceae bacterium]